MAYTSNLPNSGADFSADCSMIMYSPQDYILPALPQDGYSPNKGDLWKLNLKTSFKITRCLTIDDIHCISILAGSNDGWNIESIVTFAVVNRYNWELISADLNMFQWNDIEVEAQKEFTLSLRTSPKRCLLYFLCIMAYS